MHEQHFKTYKDLFSAFQTWLVKARKHLSGPYRENAELAAVQFDSLKGRFPANKLADKLPYCEDDSFVCRLGRQISRQGSDLRVSRLQHRYTLDWFGIMDALEISSSSMLAQAFGEVASSFRVDVEDEEGFILSHPSWGAMYYPPDIDHVEGAEPLNISKLQAQVRKRQDDLYAEIGGLDKFLSDVKKKVESLSAGKKNKR